MRFETEDITTEGTEKKGTPFLNNSVHSKSGYRSSEFPLKDITERIISCAIEVHSALGPGLLESIYEEALAQEFGLRGILFEKQKEISLRYKGKDIGNHRIDYLVENEVIVELKAVEAINNIHAAQVLT